MSVAYAEPTTPANAATAAVDRPHGMQAREVAILCRIAREEKCKTILEVGMATIFTAITLAVGVATWSFSGLKFQADMGKLLALMFIVNLVMAMTALPALAVYLERIFPRRRPVRVPGLAAH